MDVSISAGRFKGKKLRIKESLTDFRPTKLMVREAVCSSIIMDIKDAAVLELCGGSGVLSIELLSRGAAEATVVELSHKRAEMIEQFGHDLALNGQLEVIEGDITSVLPNQNRKYHIIFFDPPYYTDHLADLLPDVLNLLAPYGVLIFEHASDDTYISSIEIPSTYKEKIKKYGQTTVRYYRKKE